MKKLAVITTHPIQYNVPLFKTLAKRGIIDIKVFYTWSQSQNGFFDREFNKMIDWDIPLLDGYNYEFIQNISRKPSSKYFRGIICPDLISTVQKWNPDVVLIYGWAFHAHLKVLKYFKEKIPVFFRGDSTLLDEKFGIKKAFRNILLKYIYRFVDYAFYVGTHNKFYFLRAGLKESQLIYLPYTIDKNHFRDNKSKNYTVKAIKIRERLGINRDDKVLAFIGKFINKKNPVFLLKAVQKYNSQNETSVKLLFIGNGKLEKPLNHLSENDNNVFFLPFVNQKEMPTAYRIADIFVLPSKGPKETWGVSVNEALICGRFVLVSNKVGSAVDLIKNNDTGEIFESNNIKSFIEKLKILIEKGRFAENPYIKSFDLENAAETIETLIYHL